jgi:hypothetical protein
MDYSSGRNHGCRLLQHTHRALTHLVMENELLRVTVLADKGADIMEFLHKPSDTDFMWRERGGLREPAKVIATSPGSLGANLDWYEGGWHECLPGGGPAIILGASEGLHGEAALLPWSWTVDEDSPDRLRVTLWCRLLRLPLLVRKTLSLRSGDPVLRIEERIINESPVEIPFLWGQHPTFGAPFLSEYCRIDMPATSFRAQPGFTAPRMLVEAGSRGSWPRTAGADGAEIDLSRPSPQGSGHAGLLCLEVEEGWYAITNTRSKVGFGLSWDASVFPYLYYWHVYNGVPDYPWFGTAYVAGLEPWTSFPMNHDAALAAGTALRLPARAELRTELAAVAYSGRESVGRITPEGQVE